MSDLVDFEDLAHLDAPDLRAVLGQVPDLDVLDALAGTSLGVRHLILTKLPAATAARLQAEIDAHGPVGFLAVQAAQRSLVEALCRLSRGGQVAFDDPADMVA